MRQYNKSLNKSSRAFREHIAPILKQKWSLDRITPCEGTESPEAQKADYEHGIDYHQKLKDAIKNGGIYPEIFCVSCVVGGKVKSCAVVRTSDLMKFISETNPPTFYNYDRDKHQRQSAVILTNKQLNDSTNQNDSTKISRTYSKMPLLVLKLVSISPNNQERHFRFSIFKPPKEVSFHE